MCEVHGRSFVILAMHTAKCTFDLQPGLPRHLLLCRKCKYLFPTGPPDIPSTQSAKLVLCTGAGELTAVRQQASQAEAASAVPSNTESRRMPAGLTTCVSPSTKVKLQARPVKQHHLPSQPQGMEPQQRQVRCIRQSVTMSWCAR